MRPLTEDETKILFQKLSIYIGGNLMSLIDCEDETYVFRLHKERVFYMSESIAKAASLVPKKSLLSMGVCLGKFTKSKKFRLGITALQHLARLTTNKVWVKAGGEQSYIYGNHVIKRHIGRMTDGLSNNMGVIICSMDETPLGFGVLAKSSSEVKTADAENIIVYHQTDIGEYLREEVDLI
ncbi:60S ribosome subunit biogenesis protein NIP7, putative [Cryptosporidium muris RN66]|uniref:60S ribosome subunit biogenesis protein NIP7 homolog n=1 Tax=Cryptosporidium muris (strain RN66) TaxID=441375 RepID=B6AEI9_CRYMR|nr:60S ribosome subunit biogenesis protein NIP7, putative [Cryptosporidium muris RN66]EEA06606.1 60S ribosome subunit biogenesis protein NIP7, putative [Cryptosporidium muris RN66]|eukprot:XP_002140955.1 60S ribosome subunit biogenesis protein NIP7 [Cryptosporidium muris RN66]